MEFAQFFIRVGVSMTMVVFGAHQMLRPGLWLDYIPRWLEKILPTGPKTFMRVHGLGNILLGFFLHLNLFPKAAAWLVFFWWLVIIPFAFRKNWTIGLRDLTILFAIIAYLILIY